MLAWSALHKHPHTLLTHTLARAHRQVLFQQMLGRGLRLFPGKDDCLVLDLVDNFDTNTTVTVLHSVQFA